MPTATAVVAAMHAADAALSAIDAHTDPAGRDAALTTWFDAAEALAADSSEEARVLGLGWWATDPPRPVQRCGYVLEDGCCGHREAATPECHPGVNCPVLRALLDA